ncbi:MAG: cation:dicarboxylase symporter family transporter [Sphaerochaetaceae bacterium]
MKTWITYLAAVAMGLSATLLLGDYAIFTTIMEYTSAVLMDVGLFILFPMVFIIFTSGIAALRRHARTVTMFSTTIFWSLLTAVILSGFSAAIFLVFPKGVDHITTMGSDVSALTAIAPLEISQLIPLLIARNSFVQFFITDKFLLPLLMVAFLLGIALKPDMEIVRPAYVVMNSFSEALFRLARMFTLFSAFCIGVISCHWFNTLDAEELFFKNLRFFSVMGIGLFAALFILLPLLYTLATRFRGGNPYRILGGVLSACVVGFFTSNILYTATPLIATSRQNNGVQKSVVGTTVPLYSLIGRGGSALVATIAIISLTMSVQGAVPPLRILMYTAGLSTLFSMLCSIHLGYEVLFIVTMVLRTLGIDLQGAQMMVVLLLPLLNGAGLVLDTAIAAFGSAYTSRTIGPRTPVAYRDIL